MKEVILITSSFPYSGGEQFLETEIKYYENISLIIMPKTRTNIIRDISKNIRIDNFLIEQSFSKHKIIYLIKALSSNVLYKELATEVFFNFKKLKLFFRSLYLYQMYYELFDDYFLKYKNINNLIVYTYWNDETTYALQSLKTKYHFKLISRVHGGDLYKERRTFNYMPLKKYFTENIDIVYTITGSANEYLENTYGFDQKILKLSRLGVDNRYIITNRSAENSLNIVSCSFMTEVKQIDKIIKSLKIIAMDMKNIAFSWIHIGGGVLYDKLVEYAENELNAITNVKYNFVGNYNNKKVYEFYKENEVDVFINVSESEGVPVSIMEAMSCNIPIIAPDIGGIKDMVVNKYNGILLNKKCLIGEIVSSLKEIEFFKDKTIRENSYKIFLEKYNAEVNYTKFMKSL